ncbi:sugar phosphate isomerase/epimerase family protein [Tropicimonas sp.]|uniref:sugar phosphate isomerase/epimerase family protein n=1 Tax=Tropicimonas sp. TaxID=2067044 RepID=UPI003A88EFB5
MRDFSYQLYSSRNFGPLPDTLKMVADLGYTQVEGYGALYAGLDDLGKLKADLARNGLAMPTGHFGFDMVRDDPARTIDIARELDMAAVIVPFLPPDRRPADAAGWRAFGAALAEAGKPVRDAGFAYGWHNHAFEFEALPDGSLPLDLILADNDVALELDLAWAQVAGRSPAELVREHSDRLIAVHLKDRASEGQNADEDGWADVGHGVMDWDTIIPAVDASAARFLVVEHDNPKDDARFASRSIATAKTF